MSIKVHLTKNDKRMVQRLTDLVAGILMQAPAYISMAAVEVVRDLIKYSLYATIRDIHKNPEEFPAETKPEHALEIARNAIAYGRNYAKDVARKAGNITDPPTGFELEPVEANVTNEMNEAFMKLVDEWDKKATEECDSSDLSRQLCHAAAAEVYAKCAGALMAAVRQQFGVKEGAQVRKLEQ